MNYKTMWGDLKEKVETKINNKTINKLDILNTFFIGIDSGYKEILKEMKILELKKELEMTECERDEIQKKLEKNQ